MKIVYLTDSNVGRITTEKSSTSIGYIDLQTGNEITGNWIGISADYRILHNGEKSAYLGDTLQFDTVFNYGGWTNKEKFRAYIWNLIINRDKQDSKFEYRLLEQIVRDEYEGEAILVSNRNEDLSNKSYKANDKVTNFMFDTLSKAVKYMIKEGIGISDLIEL